MAGVMRNEFTEAMKQTMYDWFFQKYVEIAPTYAQLFNVVPSNAAYEQYTVAVGLGDLLEKPEGDDLRADTPMEAWTVICKNRTFGRQVRFSYESVEDAQVVSNLLKSTVGTWSEAVDRTKDRWYCRMFNKGGVTTGNDIFNNTIPGVVTDSSGAMIYDGQGFFGNSHPDKVGNTYDNLEASTSLTHTNLKSAYTKYTYTNAYDERGNEIENMPDVLVIRPDELFNARVILANTAIPGSFDNDINVLAAIVDLLVWPRLDTANVWYLGRRKAGLMATDRQGPKMDLYQDETNKDFYATLFVRWGGCITDWRPWIGGNCSSS